MAHYYPGRIISLEPPADGLQQQEALVQDVSKLFMRKHPSVIGAAIAELLAVLVAGSVAKSVAEHEQMKVAKALIEATGEMALELVPAIAADMVKNFGGVEQ